jgi:hypothetical protein
MKGLAAGILVSVACSAPLLAQERDRSLERISLALQQPLPIVPGVDPVESAAPKTLGIFTLASDRTGRDGSRFRPLASSFHERSKVSQRRIGDAKRQAHGGRWKRHSNGSSNSSHPPSSECDRTSINRYRMAGAPAGHVGPLATVEQLRHCLRTRHYAYRRGRSGLRHPPESVNPPRRRLPRHLRSACAASFTCAAKWTWQQAVTLPSDRIPLPARRTAGGGRTATKSARRMAPAARTVAPG